MSNHSEYPDMNTLFIINVARDFSLAPYGRLKTDGPYSAEAFRELLVSALRKSEVVQVELDGTRGYASSFLEEAFGGLIHNGFTSSQLYSRLSVITDDRTLKTEIFNYIKEVETDTTVPIVKPSTIVKQKSSRAVFIVKPDAYENRDKILNMVFGLRLKPIEMKTVTMQPSQVDAFYPDIVGKEFYPAHRDFMTSGPSLVCLLESHDRYCVNKIRSVVGSTDPKLANLNTIRGIYGICLPRNACHASDSEESALIEEKFWFGG